LVSFSGQAEKETIPCLDKQENNNVPNTTKSLSTICRKGRFFKNRGSTLIVQYHIGPLLICFCSLDALQDQRLNLL